MLKIDLKSRNTIAVLAAILVVIVVVVAVVYKAQMDEKARMKNAVISRTPTDALKVDLNKVDFSVMTSERSTKDLTAVDKRAIYESLLASFKAFLNKDPFAIRTYAMALASSPAEKALVNGLSDQNLIDMSASISKSLIMPTPDIMLAPSSIWRRDGNVVTIEYTDPDLGMVTKKAVYANGQWY
jgi:hypothetical protein